MSMRMLSGVTERGSLGSARAVGWRRLLPPSPLTTDQHVPFRIPSSDAECDVLLAAAECRAREQPQEIRQEVVADIARFLGATSRIWTPSRRSRLRRILAEAGLCTIGPVLRIVSDTPRDDVMDEAVTVLSSAAELDGQVAVALVEALVHVQSGLGPTDSDAVREVMLRSLVRAQSPVAHEERVRVAFRLAKVDPSPAVRDAAVQALSMMGTREGRDILVVLLEKLRESESNQSVVESIDEAIDTLRNG